MPVLPDTGSESPRDEYSGRRQSDLQRLPRTAKTNQRICTAANVRLKRSFRVSTVKETGLNLSTTIALYGGGPGSGRYPAGSHTVKPVPQKQKPAPQQKYPVGVKSKPTPRGVTTPHSHVKAPKPSVDKRPHFIMQKKVGKKWVSHPTHRKAIYRTKHEDRSKPYPGGSELSQFRIVDENELQHVPKTATKSKKK